MRRSPSAGGGLLRAFGSVAGLAAVGSPSMGEGLDHAGHVPEPLNSSLPHHGFSARNTEWLSIQHAIIALFQGKKPSGPEMTMLCQSVSALAETDIGPFIFEYYTNQLLKRAMQILYNGIDKSSDETLLSSLETVWLRFYTEILPVLITILKPVRVPSGQHPRLTLRRMTAVVFRDLVVLKSPLDDVMAKEDFSCPPRIAQMLLVLQYAREQEPPSANYLRLESLCARAVTPLLGYRGLYGEKGELVVEAKTIPKPDQENKRPSPGHRRQMSLQPLELASPGPVIKPPRRVLELRRHTLNEAVISGHLSAHLSADLQRRLGRADSTEDGLN